MPLALGTLLKDRYRINSILGQGGMGAVYRANDENLNISVAVKENLFLTEEYGRQFKKEASILASLRHTNLPHVTDYFALEGQGQYLVMDYIEGEDLRQRMERMGVLPEEEVILIGVSICEALTYLHTREFAIIHRDIKPGNIKVTPDGQAMLVDFGLAKIMEENQATSTGARAMTPGYSPPEQYGTARTDPRSDVYSLGATLYAALTGVIPEDGLARMTGKAELTDLRSLRPGVNRKLAEAITEALEIAPEYRFQSSQEFRRALLDAGNISNLFRERPTITPPPMPSEGGEIENANPRRKASAPVVGKARRRSASIPLWSLVPVTALIVALVYFGFSMRPFNLPSAVATDTAQVPTSSSEALAETPASPEAITPGAITAEPEAPIAASATAEAPAAPTETVQPSPTPIGGPPGEIAFTSNRTGVMQIWLMSSDGKNQRQISNQRDGACQPAWSPDGMRLAFISPCKEKKDQYEGASIYLMNYDGSGLTPLPASPEGDFDPAWAPDGERIAFTSLRGGKSAIYVINLQDYSLQELSQTRFSDKHPTWAPGGMQIAFVRQMVTGQIWIMSDNGQLQSQFAISGNVNDLWPVWLPDASAVLYSQMSPDTTVPWLVGMRYEDRKTSAEFRIPSASQVNIGPVSEVSISPDGFWLTYESWPDGVNHDIYTMSINGANQRRLTTDRDFDFSPAWRPTPKTP